MSKMFLISHQPVKNDLKTYDNVQKATIGNGYSTVCLLDYPYLK